MRGAGAKMLRSPAERDRLVEQFLPLVRYVVARLPVTMPGSLDRDDFYSVGVMGLMHAAATFDPGRGASFKTFAYTAIRGAILDEVRKHDPVPRNRRDRLRRMERTSAAMHAELDREPTLAELAAAMGCSERDLDEDLQALVTQEAGAADGEHWRLVTMNQASGMGEKPHATVVMAEEGKEKKAKAQGDGPVDATFKAIESLAKSGAELLLYSVNNITTGTDSQGEVTVRLSKGGRIVNGQGADTDIVVASAKAYINALNKLHSKLERAHPQV